MGLERRVLSDAELDWHNTPMRIARMWVELSCGMFANAPKVSAFPTKHSQILMLRDIPFTSVCAHHMAPFTGTATVAYIPDQKLCGISKPARLIDFFAARPQVQERLTNQIALYLETALKPKGVAVILKAKHTCVTCRGVRKPDTSFTTCAIRGVFAEDAKARAELMSLVNSETK